MDWLRFLEIARCPYMLDTGMCGGELEKDKSGLICKSCGMSYPLNDYGIPLFYPRTQEEKRNDHYEDTKYAEKYAGLWAYGASFLGRGEAEGLYGTIAALGMIAVNNSDHPIILDVGCGVGRTACDFGHYFPSSFSVGIDLSEGMLDLAYEIIVGNDSNGKKVELDLTPYGFGRRQISPYRLDNVFLTQGYAEKLPFVSADTHLGFDLVVGFNILDRLLEPEKAISEMMRVLKPNGYLVLCTPLNWGRYVKLWEKYGVDGVAIIQLLKDLGAEIESKIDGIVYREIEDTRSYTDWMTLVLTARKRTP